MNDFKLMAEAGERDRLSLSARLDRVTAERDALQERLTIADQRADDLCSHLDQAHKFVEATYGEAHYGVLTVAGRKDIAWKIDESKAAMAAGTSTNSIDLEHSRYSWLQAAQAAEKRVEVLEGLLREVVGDSVRWMFPGDLHERIRYALSASAEPAQKLVECDACPRISGCVNTCMKAPASAEPSAPVERDEQQGFAQWTHETIEFEHRGVTRKIQRCDLMDSEAEKNAWAGWQARAALDKATEGASHE